MPAPGNYSVAWATLRFSSHDTPVPGGDHPRCIRSDDRRRGLLPGPAAALVAASVILGIARGAFTLMQSTAISDRWGIAGFGTLYGILNAPTTMAMAITPWAGQRYRPALGRPRGHVRRANRRRCRRHDRGGTTTKPRPEG